MSVLASTLASKIKWVLDWLKSVNPNANDDYVNELQRRQIKFPFLDGNSSLPIHLALGITNIDLLFILWQLNDAD